MEHIPVLLEETVHVLAPQAGDTFFDGTAGFGGHASRIIREIGPTGSAVLVDRDSQAIAALYQRFDQTGESIRIIQSDYHSAADMLQREGVVLDMVLLDLGVSSVQLDVPERGFSFRASGPLDMRMNQTAGTTAADLVNSLPERDLANLIYRYGEERKSRRIAAAIVASRPFHDTAELADCIAKAIGRHEDIHPATRTFQALRIAVNDELGQLESALPVLADLLAPGGRIAVISFHSLEDRIVKEFFRRESIDCICPSSQPVCTCDHVAILKRITRKPIAGTIDSFNPRARSAKLRAAAKLKPKIKETP